MFEAISERLKDSMIDDQYLTIENYKNELEKDPMGKLILDLNIQLDKINILNNHF